MEVVHINQRQLAARWDISEATLERWRSEGIGPKFLKLPVKRVGLAAIEFTMQVIDPSDMELEAQGLRILEVTGEYVRYPSWKSCHRRWSRSTAPPEPLGPQ